MDLINKLSDILDNNVRIVRYSAPILATIGVVIILRKTYAFSMFKAVHDIPKVVIAKHWNIRGVVEGVIDGRTISVQHIPILFRNLEKRKQYLGEDPTPIHIALCGMEPRPGAIEYLQKEVLLKQVRVVSLGINSNDELEAKVYFRKGLFRSVCLNEEIVRQGMAVVNYDRELNKSKEYVKLSRELLRAEIYADKKGVGLWKRPSLWERLKTRVGSLKFKLGPFGRKSQ